MHDEFEFRIPTSGLYGPQVRMAKGLIGEIATIGAGALGGLFGKTKTGKVELDPKVHKALNELLKLGGKAGSIGKQGVAGLSDIERSSLDIVRDYISSGPGQTYEDAKGRLKGILDQPQDIRELPEYKAIVGSSTREGNDMLNRLLRHQQTTGGPARGTPEGKALGKQVGYNQENLVARLSPLAQEERAKQYNTISQLLGLGQYEDQLPGQKAAFGLQAGAIPRGIADAENASAYNQQLNQIQLPADIYSRVTGSPAGQPIVTRPSPTTNFSNAMGGASAMAQLLPYIFPQQGGSPAKPSTTGSRNTGVFRGL